MDELFFFSQCIMTEHLRALYMFFSHLALIILRSSRTAEEHKSQIEQERKEFQFFRTLNALLPQIVLNVLMVSTSELLHIYKYKFISSNTDIM